MSVMGRLSAMLADGGDERMARAMLKLVPMLKSKAASGSQKVIMLRKIADEVVANVEPHTICHRGCSYCCHQHVMISELEARHIEEATGRKRAKVAPIEGADALRAATTAKQAQYIGVPCTFLGAEGECTVYEHRPIRCRTHFSLAEDVELCNTERGLHVKDLPMYENEALTQTYAMLTYQTTLADIREFFPREESKCRSRQVNGRCQTG